MSKPKSIAPLKFVHQSLLALSLLIENSSSVKVILAAVILTLRKAIVK